MAFSALTGIVPLTAWLLLLANLFWTVSYDTFYAMSDRPDDLKIGVKSTAVLFGRYDLLFISLFYLASFATLVLIGVRTGLNVYFYLGIFVAGLIAILLVYQARERNRQACFHVFVNNSWIGGVVFAGIVLAYL